ncbi:MAG: hypothetical protein LBQ57_09340 [Spirochaetales bacterium]|jgi:hypothetical protein|nr:hypothetical protein [Spirochaetales bacterium]
MKALLPECPLGGGASLFMPAKKDEKKASCFSSNFFFPYGKIQHIITDKEQTLKQIMEEKYGG